MTYKVEVVRRYVPVLHRKVPSYGVQISGAGNIVIAVGDDMPEEVLPLLRDELEQHLLNMTVAAETVMLYADRISFDYLQAHVLSGNMRFDQGKSAWRWIGGPNPADNRQSKGKFGF